jgi:AcrR family transcriptional regulator
MSGKTLAPVQDRIDRRVRRTRAALQQALIELLPCKPYEQITVEDICAAGDIGRSTFYAHYRGKEDLQRAAIGDRLGNMLAERRRASPGASPTLVILEHVRDYRRLHRGPIRGRGTSVAIEALRRSVTDMLRDEVGTSSTETAFERDFRTRYLVGAFMEVLIWWLDRGARETPEQVEEVFQTLSKRGALSCG